MARSKRNLPMERGIVLLAPVHRWSAGRKARLLDAISLGIVTEEAVARAHNLQPDEIEGWRRQRARAGIAGLHLRDTIASSRENRQ